MSMTDTPLYQIVSAAGLEPRALGDAGGGVLVTIRGARVLGIFLDGHPENLLWTNPHLLADEEHARQAVQDGEWNVGGDRCWLAPELELHFENPEEPSHDEYAVPAAIDPGRYTVRNERTGAIELKAVGEAQNLLSGRGFAFEMQRLIRLCPVPWCEDGLSCVGYELSSELRVTNLDRPEACYGMWQLMQLPPGGQIHIPKRSKPELVDYFRTDVAAHCRELADQIIFPVTGTAQHKLGLRADHAVGIMGYYRETTPERATLIVRNASVFAGGLYADYPAGAPDRRDIALQFYNDGGAIGGFGEMEYHAIAATRDNFFTTRDVSRTWCFAGPPEKVQAVGRTLLGVSVGQG